ncbi:MAG TPA: alpha/beta hydrolase [Saprospiraceae bacterium]|nr:alpha/beta hydrolase [Saprospiraceae bacterium]
MIQQYNYKASFSGGRLRRRNIFFFLLITLLIGNNSLFAQNKIKAEKISPLTIGQTIELHSDILNEKRILNIYLPYGYSPDSIITYPVIYLLDGTINEDFLHIAGLVQFGSFSWIKLIPETIVVGISNIDRKRDYTFPTRVKKHRKEFPTAGGSENFINFLAKEIQPFIKSTYKTNGTRTLIGQSLGGLLATEILLKQPDLFDNYLIISPSLWWDKESLLKYNPKNYTSQKSIYIAVGKEGEIMEREAKALYTKLNSIKKENTKLFFQFFEKQNHADVLHLATYNAFEKLFKAP